MNGAKRALREFKEYIEKLGDKMNDNKDEYAQFISICIGF